MAHILLVVAPRGVGTEALEASVARTLASIQAPGLTLPVSTGSLGAAAWAVLAPPFESLARSGLAALGELTRTEARMRLSLPALTIELTPDFLRAETDLVGGRTLWYAESNGALLISTSQRALIAWLGELQPADSAVGWFMLTGCLGPGASWDRRVRAMPPAAALHFNRASLRLEVVQGASPRFVTPRAPGAELQKELLTTLEAVVGGVPRGSRTALSLSGGLDSTLLLHLLDHGRSLQCVSWGAADALRNPGTDAAVARRLAHHYGAAFRFLPIHPTPLDEAVDGFVAASEGRIDHLTGYLDGLALWKSLATEGQVQLLIRGDEAFGWVPVLTSSDVRRSVGAPELRDFGNASALRKNGLVDLAIPPLPDSLCRRAETLPAWRDRLYQEFRIPNILAALTTVKASYVETYNPLLDARILRIVGALPDAERTDKRFVRRLAKELLAMLPPFAATADGAVSTPRSEVARLASQELEGRELAHHLPMRLRAALQLSASATARQSPATPSPSAARTPGFDFPLPTWVRRVARNTIAKQPLSADKLLLRALLLSRTMRTLQADARRRTAAPHLST